MGWEPNFFADGTPFTAAQLNSRFEAVETWVNDIERDGLQRGCFNHFHAYQIIGGGSENPPYTIAVDNQDHVYDITTYTTTLQWNAFGQDGATDRVVIGNASVGGSYTGSPIVYTFDGSGPLLGMSRGDRTGVVLCLLNVEVRHAAYISGNSLELIVCMQYQVNGAGTWYTIPITEAWLSHDDHVITETSTTEFIGCDIPAECIITASRLTLDGLDPATDRLTGVRAMVTTRNATIGGEGVTLERVNLSCVPFHCELA